MAEVLEAVEPLQIIDWVNMMSNTALIIAILVLVFLITEYKKSKKKQFKGVEELAMKALNSNSYSELQNFYILYGDRFPKHVQDNMKVRIAEFSNIEAIENLSMEDARFDKLENKKV